MERERERNKCPRCLERYGVVVLHSRGGEVLELDGMTLMRRNGKIVMSPATWPRYDIFRPSPHRRLYIVAHRFQFAVFAYILPLLLVIFSSALHNGQSAARASV